MSTPPDLMRDPAMSLRELLAFYVEAGVDCALMDAPVNRLSDETSEPAAPPAQVTTPHPLMQRAREIPRSAERADASPAPDVAIAAARTAAATAPDLAALRTLMEGFEGCALRATATQLVFADGNPQAKLMLVGEAPGRDEDIEGVPFIGASGKLLDLMLAAIGLDRTSCYIANVIPWRPPGNRDPSPHEMQVCLPFIRRHIELVDPDVLVCLGKSSSQAVLNLTDGIMKTRGKWRDYDTGTRTIKAMATLHPAYLLRSPSYKRMSWIDLRAIAKALKAGPDAAAN